MSSIKTILQCCCGNVIAIIVFWIQLSIVTFLVVSPFVADDVVVVSANEGSSPTVTWTIYHSWNPQQDFVRRGSLIWSGSNNNGNGDEQPTTYNNNKEVGGDNLLTVVNDVTLTGQSIQEMLEYGWYHVKIVPDNGNNNDSDNDNIVMGTVPACTLRRANFKDQFDITLPRSSLGGTVDPLTSLSYMPLVSPLAPKTCDEYPTLDDDITRTFTSKATATLDTPAMTIKNILPQSKPPPGVAFSKKATQQQQHSSKRGGASTRTGPGGGSNPDEDNEDDGDEGTDQPPPVTGVWSFLQKYWYILLPITIMQLLAPPPEPPEQQGGGNSPEGGQAGTATAAPGGGGTPGASAPGGGGSGGGTKGTRRGKRS